MNKTKEQLKEIKKFKTLFISKKNAYYERISRSEFNNMLKQNIVQGKSENWRTKVNSEGILFINQFSEPTIVS